MTANELRIGNIVSIELHDIDTNCKISEIHNDGVCIEGDGTTFFLMPGVNGIPLTPEMLEKCGFWFIHETQSWLGQNGEVFVNNADNYAFQLYGDTPQSHIALQSLHHFQNVYYFTTGEELNINL